MCLCVCMCVCVGGSRNQNKCHNWRKIGFLLKRTGKSFYEVKNNSTCHRKSIHMQENCGRYAAVFFIFLRDFLTVVNKLHGKAFNKRHN